MPSPTKVQLTGGQFQDSEGNVLANGYLKMRLNQDSAVADSQICSGIELTILLDANGNVKTSPAQSVWGNDQLLPPNSFYRVTGYTAAGQPAWGPNNQQVFGNGGTFDVGTWIPNAVISWSPSAQSLALQIAGTALSSQAVLNFVNTGNVTFTDAGNGKISASAVTGAAVGDNVVSAPSTTMSNHGTGLNTDAVTYSQLFTASSILKTPSHWKITVNVAVGPISFQNFVVARTLPGSLTVIDYTPITFGGTANPTFSVGLNTSDSIALQIDTAHDYWFMAYSVHQSGAQMYSYATQFFGNTEGGVISGGTGNTAPYFNDYTDGAAGSPNTIVPPNTAFGLWLSPWQVA